MPRSPTGASRRSRARPPSGAWPPARRCSGRGRSGAGIPGSSAAARRGAGLDGAAEYLGLTEAQLRERLRDGDSLAEVAEAENKSVDGLKAAIKTGITAKLDEAVKAGRLTEAQKTRMLRNIDERIDALVNNERPRLRRWR